VTKDVMSKRFDELAASEGDAPGVGAIIWSGKVWITTGPSKPLDSVYMNTLNDMAEIARAHPELSGALSF
jgi:hypothetical protein